MFFGIHISLMFIYAMVGFLHKIRFIVRGIVICRSSAYLNCTARIKSCCSLIENRFEIGNFSYHQRYGQEKKTRQQAK